MKKSLSVEKQEALEASKEHGVKVVAVGSGNHKPTMIVHRGDKKDLVKELSKLKQNNLNIRLNINLQIVPNRAYYAVVSALIESDDKFKFGYRIYHKVYDFKLKVTNRIEDHVETISIENTNVEERQKLVNIWIGQISKTLKIKDIEVVKDLIIREQKVEGAK